MRQHHQWRIGIDLGAQGSEAAAQALMHFFVGGVVGFADLAVTTGIAEKQGADAPKPASTNRLLTQPVEKCQLAYIQHTGPVPRLEGDLVGLGSPGAGADRQSGFGKGMQAIFVVAVWLATSAVDDGDRKFHDWPSLVVH